MDPGFEEGGRKILFFTRGRGRGHAIADMEIARHLAAIEPGVQIRFVSYAAGAETFAAYRVPHIDLGLPERNPINETIVLAGKLIGNFDPDLVVAHEEFMALPGAKIFGKPAVMITDWFAQTEQFAMGSLQLADRIMFLDEPGIYEEPEWVRGRVDYVGPVVREFRYRRSDREAARAELGLPADAFLVAVFPGGWREADHPILNLVKDAFALLPHASKNLIWLAGNDMELIRARVESQPAIVVLGYDPLIDRVMAACDIAITKGTRKTLFELQAMGTPSMSLANPVTQVDRFRAARFPANTPFDREDGPQALARCICTNAAREIAPVPMISSGRRCAELILGPLDSI
jgi:UDP-N-acetylglucosamine:LPS N-acetylglucosamine transferase